MGIPSFYRWLVGKYPQIVVNAIEEEGDTSQPNPNGMEFHNLYLDMNEIIYACFKAEDQPFPPTTLAELFDAVFEYIDRIFRIVRPRRLLYMALDGVAPRAKMNQKRYRTFMSAKDAETAEAEEERLREEFKREGKEVRPKKEKKGSDSIMIAPGTKLMERLSKALEFYTRMRLNSDPGWASIKVILSDARVPGEGEHKIMSYIRLQRNLPGYDHDTRHCLYGHDADLIMLALATHEVHFFILREGVLKQEEQCISLSSIEASLSTPKKPYQFLNVWTLREYLALDMTIPNPPFNIDIERIVDDFIFICFFVGNDFVPNLPTLEMHEGAIDLLIAVYKKLFKKMDDYLIDTSKIKEKNAAYINVKRLEQFLHEVGSYEDKIFEKRYKSRQKILQRWSQQRAKEGEADHDFDNWRENSRCRFRNFTTQPVRTFDQVKTCVTTSTSETISAAFTEKCSTSSESSEVYDVIVNTEKLEQKLKDLLHEKVDRFKTGAAENDKVNLGFPGWRGRYYREKFSAESPAEIESIRLQIVEKYMEGICWVLQYYFAGVCSWGWHYPFHYGPFASDLKGLCCSKISFKIGTPFKPFDELLAILPAQCSSALPKAYRHLMNSEDSPIIKFYPTDFSVDTDGKRFTWQGVARLPFVDEILLLNETKLLEKQLEIDEVERNTLKYDKIIVLDSHVLGNKICSIYTVSEQTSQRTGNNYPIDEISCEINGFLSLCDDNSILNICSSIEGGITEDHAISAIFQNPDYHDHVPKLLANATLPAKTITEADIDEKMLWHEYKEPYQQNMSQHKYATRLRESASPASNREICKAAGSGWSGVGSGNEAMSREYRIYGGGNPARSIGRGHRSLEMQHFGQRNDSSRGNNAMNWNQGSRGYDQNLSTSYDGYRPWAGGFQQSMADRSENWRSQTVPAAAESGRGLGRGWSGSSNPTSGRGAGASTSDLHGRGDGRTRW